LKAESGIRERILRESVRLFSEKGYHGASMRDIAAAAECSLPMLYYYFKNKEELFYAVAYSEFVLLIERLNREIEIAPGGGIQEAYIQAIRQRKALSSYDRAVYKLSLKAWLGFDGDTKARRDLMAWENGRVERTRRILARHIADPAKLDVFASLVARVMENMMEKILLLDEDIPDTMIRSEIECLMTLMNQSI